jgi:hypothetical protein
VDEKEARELSADERLRLRQAQAKQVLDNLDAWLAAQLTRIDELMPWSSAPSGSADYHECPACSDFKQFGTAPAVM